jgi:hypothetical protein
VEALGEASSHGFKKAGYDSFGGTELLLARQSKSDIAGLLIGVLTRLGGAFQKDWQPAFLVFELIQEARWESFPSRFFWFPISKSRFFSVARSD